MESTKAIMFGVVMKNTRNEFVKDWYTLGERIWRAYTGQDPNDPHDRRLFNQNFVLKTSIQRYNNDNSPKN